MQERPHGVSKNRLPVGYVHLSFINSAKDDIDVSKFFLPSLLVTSKSLVSWKRKEMWF